MNGLLSQKMQNRCFAIVGAKNIQRSAFELYSEIGSNKDGRDYKISMAAEELAIKMSMVLKPSAVDFIKLVECFQAFSLAELASNCRGFTVSSLFEVRDLMFPHHAMPEFLKTALDDHRAQVAERSARRESQCAAQRVPA